MVRFIRYLTRITPVVLPQAQGQVKETAWCTGLNIDFLHKNKCCARFRIFFFFCTRFRILCPLFLVQIQDAVVFCLYHPASSRRRCYYVGLMSDHRIQIILVSKHIHVYRFRKHRLHIGMSNIYVLLYYMSFPLTMLTSLFRCPFWLFHNKNHVWEYVCYYLLYSLYCRVWYIIRTDI